MKSDKPESVQGFLASTKLLTSKMKSHTTKNKMNRTATEFQPATPSESDRSMPLKSPKRLRESYKKKNEENRS